MPSSFKTCHKAFPVSLAFAIYAKVLLSERVFTTSFSFVWQFGKCKCHLAPLPLQSSWLSAFQAYVQQAHGRIRRVGIARRFTIGTIMDGFGHLPLPASPSGD